MKIEVDITDEDLVALWRSFVRVPQNRVPDPKAGIPIPDSKPSLGWFLATMIVIITAVLTILHLSSILRLDAPTAVVTIFVVVFFFWAILWRQISRTGVEFPDGYYLGHHTYVFEPGGIRRTSPHIDMFVRWSGVRTIYETTQHVFLMIDRTNGYIFPKRCFPSEDDLHDFTALIERYKNAAQLENDS